MHNLGQKASKINRVRIQYEKIYQKLLDGETSSWNCTLINKSFLTLKFPKGISIYVLLPLADSQATVPKL
jgi:hypothetical protein